MLALRLVRGSRPLVLLRRLMVAAASAGVGFLLLCTLGHALSHPGPDHTGSSALRLLWCLAPLAATVQLAAVVARTDPTARPRPGLSAVGLGPARIAAVAAASSALSCGVGSMLALLVFLHLRGDLTGLPFDGKAAGLLAADRPLPLAAVLTLLALVPLAAAAATALTLRPRRDAGARAGAAVKLGAGSGGAVSGSDPRPGPGSGSGMGLWGSGADGVGRNSAAGSPAPAPPVPASPPAGLPWGVALTAAGLAVETYASRGTGSSRPLPLPGHPEIVPAGVLAGWALTALGLALAGPGLVHLCGFLLQAVRPGAVRLLAGRTLQGEARRIGRPLGVVCATASGVLAARTLYTGADAAPSFGPLTGLGAGLVLACTTATLLTVALETKQSRAPLTQALVRQGAPTRTLRVAALLRALVLLALFAPLTWAVATLAAAPLAA
ncbi:hypothetical protein [Streptomyces candidus]|uniref:Uncharacterized protein n=1 Tax=Streptomyces candidus TaxID=67283 RepID=A0A7X0HIP6_9ACTN|nr:hypothetical protein [Streptomyces candidus]MBB6438381.1 hypothetical protein [Streptomyces candidus]GHH52221.1 hypothetical protein GCM10018773_51860 [Streptomyces candidus]